jgi:small subunit ribosomal protein S6
MQTIYETIFILQPELTDEQVEAAVGTFEQVVKSAHGELRKTEKWGKKRLAYRVKKSWEGFYVLFEYASPAAAVAELERRLRIHENVLKWISVRKDPRAEAEEERRAARMARAQRAGGRPGEGDDEGMEGRGDERREGPRGPGRRGGDPDDRDGTDREEDEEAES